MANTFTEKFFTLAAEPAPADEVTVINNKLNEIYGGAAPAYSGDLAITQLNQLLDYFIAQSTQQQHLTAKLNEYKENVATQASATESSRKGTVDDTKKYLEKQIFKFITKVATIDDTKCLGFTVNLCGPGANTNIVVMLNEIFSPLTFTDAIVVAKKQVLRDLINQFIESQGIEFLASEHVHVSNAIYNAVAAKYGLDKQEDLYASRNFGYHVSDVHDYLKTAFRLKNLLASIMMQFPATKPPILPEDQHAQQSVKYREEYNTFMAFFVKIFQVLTKNPQFSADNFYQFTTWKAVYGELYNEENYVFDGKDYVDLDNHYCCFIVDLLLQNGLVLSNHVILQPSAESSYIFNGARYYKKNLVEDEQGTYTSYTPITLADLNEIKKLPNSKELLTKKFRALTYNFNEDEWSKFSTQFELEPEIIVALLKKLPSIPTALVNPIINKLKQFRTENSHVDIIGQAMWHKDLIKKLLKTGVVDVNCKEDGLSFLYTACRDDDLAIVNALLNSQAIKINEADQNGRTPLYIACRNDNLAIAQALLRSLAIKINEADQGGRTPLYIACRNGNLAIVQALLQHNAIEVNQADEYADTPLSIACAEGNFAIVQELLRHIDVNVNLPNNCEKTPLHIACENNNLEIVYELIQREDLDVNLSDGLEKTPLYIACENNNLAIVRELIQREDLDVNLPDITDKTPLHIAGENANFAIVYELIKKKASLPDDSVVAKIIITQACKDGEWQVIQEIIQQYRTRDNSDAQAQHSNDKHIQRISDLKFALPIAVKNYQWQIVEELLQYVDLISKELGEEILLSACRCGQEKIINTLLEKQAININKALQIACQEQHWETTLLLLTQDDLKIDDRSKLDLLDAVNNNYLPAISTALEQKGIIKQLHNAPASISNAASAMRDKSLAIAPKITKPMKNRFFTGEAPITGAITTTTVTNKRLK